jgi:short-subunit dehydrogenase
MKNFRDYWVLITGAASGIGLALTREFAQAGANLILADINETGMKQAAAELEAGGAKTICIRADIRVPQEVEALAHRAVEQAGRVDILVNNAGLAMVAEMKDVTREEWDKILATNLYGPILLTHYLLPHFLARKSGHIVNLASMAGLIGIPGMVPYTTTKFGLVGFSLALRAELADFGVKVTAVCPGIVRTPILNNSPIKGFTQELRDASAWIMISPEKAARLILAGIKRNQAKVIPTVFLGKVLLGLSQIAPGFFEWGIRKIYASWERVPS